MALSGLIGVEATPCSLLFVYMKKWSHFRIRKFQQLGIQRNRQYHSNWGVLSFPGAFDQFYTRITSSIHFRIWADSAFFFFWLKKEKTKPKIILRTTRKITTSFTPGLSHNLSVQRKFNGLKIQLVCVIRQKMENIRKRRRSQAHFPRRSFKKSVYFVYKLNIAPLYGPFRIFLRTQA